MKCHLCDASIDASALSATTGSTDPFCSGCFNARIPALIDLAEQYLDALRQVIAARGQGDKAILAATAKAVSLEVDLRLSHAPKEWIKSMQNDVRGK